MKSKLVKLKKNQKEFPKEIYFEDDIECLEVLSDKLESIPPGLKSLKNLKIFSLNTPNLKELPSEMENLLNLHTFKLKGTEINSLSNFKLPNSIKTLIAINNKFNEIPEWIFDLSFLEQLDLSGNHIQNIPESIKKSKTLKRLVLDRNKIEDVSINIKECQNLSHLSLDGNPLSEETKKMLNEVFGMWF